MERINIIGIYDDPDVLVAAAKKLKEEGCPHKKHLQPLPYP